MQEGNIQKSRRAIDDFSAYAGRMLADMESDMRKWGMACHQVVKEAETAAAQAQRTGVKLAT